jgi:hypothetical protein
MSPGHKCDPAEAVLVYDAVYAAVATASELGGGILVAAAVSDRDWSIGHMHALDAKCWLLHHYSRGKHKNAILVLLRRSIRQDSKDASSN